MRDHNAQRPVYLLDVIKGESRVADEENIRRVSARLHSEDIPHKVLEARNGLFPDHDVFLVPEEHKNQVFEIASDLGLTSVIYLAFDRVAWLQVSDKAPGNPLGTLKPVRDDFDTFQTYFDNNRNQAYAIL